jgi:hypothetical protein
MSFKKWWALVASSALLGAMAVASGCSSSSSSDNSNNADAAPESGTIHHVDSGGPIGGDDGGGADGGTTITYDMTTGKPCSSDADCKGASGPGTNVCSSDYVFGPIHGVKVNLWPTPICLPKLPTTQGGGNCDPAPSYDPQGQGVHFCDGPDDPSSPGICLPNTTPTASGKGLCLPKCTFPTDGSPATGCPGKDTCAPYTFVLLADDAGAPKPPPVGFGFCQGTCQQDSDCNAAPPNGLGTGYTCQLDEGFCTKMPVARVADAGGAIGDSCSNPTSGESTACNCVSNNTTNAGYCTQACVVGSTTNPCPSGYTCDNGFGGRLDFGDAGGTFAYTKQTQGSAGTCFQSCTMVDAATGCPPNATCQNVTLAGPDCIP